jgi:hypothetical protein
MLRSPLSCFGGAVPPPDALAAGGALVALLVPGLPIHAAAIGIAAAAAAPLRTVRRLSLRSEPSST